MAIRHVRKAIVGGMVAGILAANVVATPAAALDLKGKTVEFVIPFSESGGSAGWANFFAPLLSKHLPGNPTVVVRYRPGAGSTEGANWFQLQKTSDGTLIFGPSGSTQFPYLLGDPRVRYEYKDWKVVLASGTGGVVYLPPDLGTKFDGDFDDLKDIDFLFGSQGATTLDLVPLLSLKLLGLNVEPVLGIEGRGDGRLMFERGEANVDYQTTAAYLKSVVPLVEQKLAVPAFTYGALDEQGNIVRDPTFPDLPTFKEVCDATKACEISGVGWEAWKAFFVAGFAAQKLIYLPGTASAEVVDTYTKAFNAMFADPEFKKLSHEILGDYVQLTGDASKKAHEQAITVTPETKQYVLDWLKNDYGISVK